MDWNDWLKQFQYENGCFPASPGSDNKEMENVWFRDMVSLWLASDREFKKSIEQGFVNYFDAQSEVIERNAKERPPIDKPDKHVQPVLTKDLKNIDRKKKWLAIQNDSLGCMAYVYSGMGDKERAKSIIENINALDVWQYPGYGKWENEPQTTRSSSLAWVVRGLRNYQKHYSSSPEMEKTIRNSMEKLLYILPDEFRDYSDKIGTRQVDLAQIMLYCPDDVIDDKELKDVIINRIRWLEGFWGAMRYPNDEWNGIGWDLKDWFKMYWTFEKALMYIATGEDHYMEDSIRIRERFGCMPEGVIRGEANVNSIFLDCEGWHKYAADKAGIELEYNNTDKIKRILSD